MNRDNFDTKTKAEIAREEATENVVDTKIFIKLNEANFLNQTDTVCTDPIKSQYV